MDEKATYRKISMDEDEQKTLSNQKMTYIYKTIIIKKKQKAT